MVHMGNILMEISVPLDKDCFIEMECDFCKNRFMLHKDVYEKEDNINFFCPICGLPNKINTFFVPEVLKKVQQKAMNYMLEELDVQPSVFYQVKVRNVEATGSSTHHS